MHEEKLEGWKPGRLGSLEGFEGFGRKAWRLEGFGRKAWRLEGLKARTLTRPGAPNCQRLQAATASASKP
jgi:hypothetical protein